MAAIRVRWIAVTGDAPWSPSPLSSPVLTKSRGTPSRAGRTGHSSSGLPRSESVGEILACVRAKEAERGVVVGEATVARNRKELRFRLCTSESSGGLGTTSASQVCVRAVAMGAFLY